MAAYGLYTHIQSNKRRSIALLIGLFFLVYVMVFAGALLAEALTVDAPLDYLLRAAQFDFLKALPFATIATGLNQKQYSITVTRGLINALNDQEIEAVLGHELTHIRNGDVRMLVIAVVIAGVISFFGELVFRIFFQNVMWGGGRRSSSDDRKGGAGLAIIIAIAIIAVVWILSIVIRFALSRQREYLADAGSVELTKNPDAMISALRKIEGRGEIPGANSAVMEMCIDNPREGFSNIFDTHPSVEARVEALVKYAGGHDSGPLEVETTRQPEQLPPGEGPWGRE